MDENNWIWDRWGTNRNLWIGLSDPVVGDGGGAEHAANFVWASAETSAYRNWNSGEPNGDACTFIFAKETGRGGQWNDTDTTDSGRVAGQSLPYGVVEVLTCTPHHATATAILYNGFLVGTKITDVGCGYTNAPLVSIQGGGGSGATATATINADGLVTDITINNAGSGYTSAPQILIASPPFVPTVRIGYSKVKVTANVMLGLNYVLESSPNLVNWSAAGAAFTATNENMTSEFDVELTGRYFRIRQVP